MDHASHPGALSVPTVGPIALDPLRDLVVPALLAALVLLSPLAGLVTLEGDAKVATLLLGAITLVSLRGNLRPLATMVTR